MLELCPTCGAEVLFTTSLCPHCLIDRLAPDPSKVAEWRERTARERADAYRKVEDADKKVEKKPNKLLGLGWSLSLGGFLIYRQAQAMNDIFQPEGFSPGVSLGSALGCVMGAVGAVMLLKCLLNRKG